MKAGFHLTEVIGACTTSVIGLGIITITYLPVKALNILIDPSYDPTAIFLPSGS